VANGDVLTASEDDNADLFWGIRGGKLYLQLAATSQHPIYHQADLTLVLSRSLYSSFFRNERMYTLVVGRELNCGEGLTLHAFLPLHLALEFNPKMLPTLVYELSIWQQTQTSDGPFKYYSTAPRC
jgi:hypothetical protein